MEVSLQLRRWEDTKQTKSKNTPQSWPGRDRFFSTLFFLRRNSWEMKREGAFPFLWGGAESQKKISL
jgi:hypothetical protein